MMKTIAALLTLVSATSLYAEDPLQKKANILDTFYPQVKNGQDLWISADLILLRPSEDAIIITNHKTNLFEVNNVTLQPALDTNFRWGVGTRIGFGYLFSDHKWDMSIQWMLYNASAKNKSETNMDISKGMFPVWSLSDDIIPYDWVSLAKGHWTLGINLLDLDFGRSFKWSWFLLRSYVGLRSAWIDQEFDVKYGGGVFSNGPDLVAMTNNAGYDQIDMENNYWGLGPRIGIEPQVNLGAGFRFYGNGCISYEVGYFYLVQDEVYLAKVRFHEKRRPFELRWILDASAGLLWETFLCNERFALTFKLGWEYHLFFHQFQLKKDQFGIVPSNRDLVLNGGAFSGRFSF